MILPILLPHIVLNYENLERAQAEEFAELMEQGVVDISKYLRLPPPDRKISVHISPDIEISQTRSAEARVFLPSERVAAGTAPYLHELTHALLGDGGAGWLEEGFASFVASEVARRFGGYYAEVLSKSNEEVDVQARKVLEDRVSRARAGEWLAMTAAPPLTAGKYREDFYILAHSFTKFLVSTLGRARVIEAHRARDPDRLWLHGRSRRELFDTWIDTMIDKMPSGWSSNSASANVSPS